MFSGDVRKIYENYNFGSCTIYFHQTAGFFDTVRLFVEAITAHAPLCKAFDSAVGAVATEVAGMAACCPVRLVIAIVSLFQVMHRYVCFCSVKKTYMDKEDKDFALEFLHCT